MVSQWIVSEQTTNRLEEKCDQTDRSATRKRILKGTVRLELCWFSRYIRVWYWFHLLKLRNLLTQAFLSWIVILYGILLTEREASCVENSVESLIILLIARAIPWLYILWLERIIQVQSFPIQSLYPWTKLTWRNERHLIIKLCTCIITLFVILCMLPPHLDLDKLHYPALVFQNTLLTNVELSGKEFCCWFFF